MILSAAAILVLSQVGSPAPDFSGTWKLDASRSRVSASSPFSGLVGAGAPETLHITEAENGVIIIESQINESHARIYTPGGTSKTPVYVGALGSITMSSRWEGGALVGEGRRESASGASSIVTEVKEKVSLGSDGRSLEIEVTTTGAEGTSTTRGIYTRIEDVGPCQSWPTPCKTPPR
jgi:hypothetical protein